MKITNRAESRDVSPMDPVHFTGKAGSRMLHSTTEPHPLRAQLVRFDAGARTHWHSHAGGQLLHVVEGEGWAQSRGEAPVRLRAGDSVSAAPGEQHWHGAAAEGAMAHVAVSVGETAWLEAAEAPAAS